MKLFSAFSKKAPNLVFFSIFLGAAAGVSYSALIPLLLNGIAPQDPNFSSIGGATEILFGIEVSHHKLAVLFFASCFFILLARSISEIILIRVATSVSKDFRLRFYEQISRAPISTIEKMGSSEIIASINLDVPRVVAGARVFPGLLVNSVSLVGMLGFLLYLNREIFGLVMGAILFGVVFYQIPMVFANRIFTHVRKVRDDLQEGIRGLVYGAKELKLNQKKRDSFFEDILLKHEDEILKYQKRGYTIFEATTSFGELVCFFVIGLVSFVFVNYHSITQYELVGVIMALLYVIGPISLILGVIPQFAVSLVAFRKIENVLKKIPKEEISEKIVEVAPWQKMTFFDVEYSYEDEDGEHGFSVGPLSFSMEGGQVTFIIGANGSGKSTLSKILTLHYQPHKGKICFGDTAVTSENVASYRQKICSIYSDYFLFDRLLGTLTEEMISSANDLLKALHLDQKVRLENGRFSTTSLSDGQKKRLALLVAFLEDKPFYLFDEWAADQDPVFKHIFYKQILPELKRKGKAVVVISHDERYFDVADRMLIMEQGRLVSADRIAAIMASDDNNEVFCLDKNRAVNDV